MLVQKKEVIMLKEKLRIFNNCIEFDLITGFTGKCQLIEGINNYICNAKSSQHKTLFVERLRLKRFSNVLVYSEAEFTRPILDGISQSNALLVVFDECEFPHLDNGLFSPEICDWFHNDTALHLIISRNYAMQGACYLRSVENNSKVSILEPVFRFDELKKFILQDSLDSLKNSESLIIVEDSKSGYYAFEGLIDQINLKVNYKSCYGYSRLLATLEEINNTVVRDVFLVVDFVEDNNGVLKVFRELLSKVQNLEYTFKVHFLNVHTFESILLYSRGIKEINEAILNKNCLYYPSSEFKNLYFTAFSMERFYTTVYQQQQVQDFNATNYSKQDSCSYPHNKLGNELRKKLAELKSSLQE